ncbi:MAG: 6-pyruvoyl trahydropterin synthase family protein [Planctomycetaceae bacterium]
MERYGVVRRLAFCYGHRIRGHAGGCRFVHGHNAVVEVECRGPLDALGMVVDFGEIGRALGGWIDAHWDHRMILQRGDPLVAMLKGLGDPVYELEGDPTAENLAAELYGAAKAAGLPVHAVRFWETPTSMASFGGA